MLLEKQNVLFFLRGSQHGGTENIVIELCKIFQPLVNKVVVASAKSGGVFEDKLSDLGIKYYSIPDIEVKTPSTILRVSKTIRQIIKEEHITVIHTHHRMAAFYVRILMLDRYCKFINTSHNTFSNHKMLTRYAYKTAHMIACGNKVKENLESFFGLTNVTVLHNAVNAFNDSTAEDDLILTKMRNQGNILIGNVGRLSEQKGMKYFVQAVPEVIKSKPNSRFFIVGSGEEEGMLRRLSKELGVEKYIIFSGYRIDVQNFMRQMDFIVLSSLWEGLPLTPIEAFSVAKTIIATAVDGTVEIVKDQENGLLIEPKDTKQMAEKMLWMIEHTDERNLMGKNAYDTFRTEFSIDRLKVAYIDYYTRI